MPRIPWPCDCGHVIVREAPPIRRTFDVPVWCSSCEARWRGPHAVVEVEARRVRIAVRRAYDIRQGLKERHYRFDPYLGIIQQWDDLTQWREEYVVAGWEKVLGAESDSAKDYGPFLNVAALTEAALEEIDALLALGAHVRIRDARYTPEWAWDRYMERFFGDAPADIP